MDRERKSKHWALIIGIALVLHLILFFSIKPGFFRMFQKPIGEQVAQEGPAVAVPNAIITIPIDVESDEAPVWEEQPEEPEKPRETPSERRTLEGDPTAVAYEIEDVTGQSPEPRPYQPGPEAATIPPRPLEITWPDTRRLKHCLGHQISVRIQVGEQGEILALLPVDGDHPSDCIEAALESAGHIVFAPGTINGLPARMWTQVRIDFRKSP